MLASPTRSAGMGWDRCSSCVNLLGPEMGLPNCTGRAMQRDVAPAGGRAAGPARRRRTCRTAPLTHSHTCGPRHRGRPPPHARPRRPPPPTPPKRRPHAPPRRQRWSRVEKTRIGCCWGCRCRQPPRRRPPQLREAEREAGRRRAHGGAPQERTRRMGAAGPGGGRREHAPGPSRLAALPPQHPLPTTTQPDPHRVRSVKPPERPCACCGSAEQRTARQRRPLPCGPPTWPQATPTPHTPSPNARRTPSPFPLCTHHPGPTRGPAP